MSGVKITSSAAVGILVILALLSITVLLGGFQLLRGAFSPTADPPTPPSPTASPVAEDPYIPAGANVSILPLAEQVDIEPGQTVVSITFDDGWDSQAVAAEQLNEHGLKGTFYVNSGNIGVPGYLTLDQLRAIAEEGHEIGGHTVTHPELDRMALDEAKRDICLDRNTLMGWGFNVRNFAYPFASSTPDVQRLVEECGYNTGRELGQLKSNFDCGNCPLGETIPPATPFLLGAPSQVTDQWTLDDLKDVVVDAQAEGGWVPLTFHKFCTPTCGEISATEEVMDEFLNWLADYTRSSNTVVLTVEEVIGGPMKPAADVPEVAAVGSGNLLTNAGLEEADPGPEQEARADLIIPKVPLCWDAESFGELRSEFSLVPGKDSATAMSLTVSDIGKGEAKLAVAKDLGACAPTVVPGETYTLETSYTSTAPVRFSVAYRLERGIWAYWTSSEFFQPAGEFTRATWTTPPIPDGATAISFGLALEEAGTVVTDDFAMATAPVETPVSPSPSP